MKKNLKKTKNQGFTLVEFIVVLVIFSIMSSVTLFNYNDYRNRIRETNVSQDIALSIRQAQVYGLSSSDRLVGDAQLDDEGVADNVFGTNPQSNPFNTQIIDITQDRSARGVVVYPGSNEIIIFEDLDRNFIYNANNDRIIDRRSIQTAGVNITGVYVCGEPNCGDLESNRVDIVFQRPYPEAYLSRGGTIAPQSTTPYVYIVLNGNNEKNSYIEITSIGRITVKKNYEIQ